MALGQCFGQKNRHLQVLAAALQDLLGNLLDLEGYNYESSTGIQEELRRLIGEVAYDGRFAGKRTISAARGGTTSELPLYQVDAIVRRATPLQLTRAGQAAAAG